MSPRDDVLSVAGRPTGAAPWRRQVAAATDTWSPASTAGLVLDFHLKPGSWVDLDTLAENTLAGLRDAGMLAAGFRGLHAFLATKDFGAVPGVTVRAAAPARLGALPAPGPAEADVASGVAPRPADRATKRAWRASLASQWGERPALSGAVWADVSLGGTRSLLGSLEVVLDGLEPVLGRDPRGRNWQEFFPNDHLIRWLRVRREPEPGVRLRLGRVRS